MKQQKIFDDIVYPFADEKFLEWWNKWKLYKLKQFRFKYKSSISEQSALVRLSELSEGDLNEAIAIIKYSISQTYHGLFKENNGKRPNKETASRANADQLGRIFGDHQ